MEEPITEIPQFPPSMLPQEPEYLVRSRSSGSTVGLTIGLLFSFGLGWYLCQALLLWNALDAVVGGFTALAFALWFWLVRRSRAVNRIVSALDEPVYLANIGKLDEAAAQLKRLAKSARKYPEFHAMVLLSLGTVTLRQGEAERALSLFGSILNSGWFADKRLALHQYFPVLLSDIALCHAVRGNLDAAEEWQSCAHDHVSPKKAGATLFLDTLIAVRRGRYETALKDAQARWSDAEGTLLGFQMKILNALLAFACSHIDKNGEHDEKIRELIAASKPYRAEQHGCLMSHWSEYREFLIQHGIAPQVLSEGAPVSSPPRSGEGNEPLRSHR